jgi:hypothetical protein
VSSNKKCLVINSLKASPKPLLKIGPIAVWFGVPGAMLVIQPLRPFLSACRGKPSP